MNEPKEKRSEESIRHHRFVDDAEAVTANHELLKEALQEAEQQERDNQLRQKQRTERKQD